MARGLVAHRVIAAQTAVALQAPEGLLDLPAPRLDDKAATAGGADALADNAVAGAERAAASGSKPEVHPARGSEE